MLLLWKEWMDRYQIKNLYYMEYKKGKDSYKWEDLFTSPKLMIPEWSSKIIAIPDSSWIFTTRSIYCCTKKTNVDIEYLAGIINSKLYDFFVLKMIAWNSWYVKLRIQNIVDLPIKIWENTEDLKNKVIKICSMEEWEERSNLIHEIDQLVYKLYWLTDEEIQIVEDSMK
jgi:hypothetical protein